VDRRNINRMCGNGTEAAQFLFREYINRNFFEVHDADPTLTICPVGLLL
jgi:hypothetical protein